MRGEKSTFEIEYLHPILKDGAVVITADIITLSTRARIGNTTALVFELPWVSGATSSSFLFSSVSESAIGNPYLGVELASPEIYFFGEIGVRLPLMAEHSTTAGTAGIAADFDRFEAYTPNLFRAGFAMNVNPPLGSGFGCRLRLGPAFDFTTREAGSSEILLDYAAIFSYDAGSVDAGAGIVGRANLSSSSSNTTKDQFECSLRLHIGQAHPALQLRTPLDEALQRIYGLEFCLNLAITL